MPREEKSDHLARARDLLAAQPECWKRCGVHPVDEVGLEAALVEATREGWRSAAREARRFGPPAGAEDRERQILKAMP